MVLGYFSLHIPVKYYKHLYDYNNIYYKCTYYIYILYSYKNITNNIRYANDRRK